MKTYLVKFDTCHESYGGYNHSDGWSEYTVEARNEKSAEYKAKKLWKKNHHSASYWVKNTSINEVK
jgi:hypothetical protein